MVKKFSLLLLLVLVTTTSWADEPSCAVAKNAFLAAQQIRGLKAKSDVPCTLQDKSQVLGFFKETAKKKVIESKIKGEARVYQALGLMPADYDYLNEILKLYSEQAGGYYDPEAKRYVMAAWLPPALQPAIAAHELTHSLQDQYFNLGRLIDDKLYSSDEVLAHSALVEGDATAVMNDFQIGARSESAIAKMESVEPILIQTVIGSYLTQSTATAPEVIKNTMIFPYISGMRFVHYFMKKGGYKAVDKIFKMPPHSTAEILHPERYPLPLVSISPDVTQRALKGEEPLYRDTMGEFFASSWLSAMIPDKRQAAQAAAGLMTDQAMVLKDNSVAWITNWENEKEMAEYQTAAEAGASKLKNFSIECVKNELSCIIRVQ